MKVSDNRKIIEKWRVIMKSGGESESEMAAMAWRNNVSAIKIMKEMKAK
jgi:hypothetical protein